MELISWDCEDEKEKDSEAHRESHSSLHTQDLLSASRMTDQDESFDRDAEHEQTLRAVSEQLHRKPTGRVPVDDIPERRAKWGFFGLFIRMISIRKQT